MIAHVVGARGHMVDIQLNAASHGLQGRWIRLLKKTSVTF
jgi:hypothetical protein